MTLGKPKGFAFAAVLAAAWTRPAQADESVISQPGRHPDYTFEAEPHVFYGLDPPGKSVGPGWGPGFRGTFEIIDNGFIKSINDSIGIGFGFDAYLFGTDKVAVWVPLVMQWNFWLSRNWSVFGEPGGGIWLGNVSAVVRPCIYGGARFHILEKLAITARVGYPAFSLGASFAF